MGVLANMCIFCSRTTVIWIFQASKLPFFRGENHTTAVNGASILKRTMQQIPTYNFTSGQSEGLLYIITPRALGNLAKTETKNGSMEPQKNLCVSFRWWFNMTFIILWKRWGMIPGGWNSLIKLSWFWEGGSSQCKASKLKNWKLKNTNSSSSRDACFRFRVPLLR